MGKILWLASYPKSGNTWMRAFLHNLIVDKGGPLDLNAMSRGALMDAAHQHYASLSDGDPRQLSREEIARLRPRMQAALAASRNGTLFVKTHTALTMLAGHPSHDPALTLGSIYMVRDPRDVALSYADHLGIGIDGAIDAMARENAQTDASEKGVTEFIGSWSQNVTSWTSQNASTVLVLRYEDMLAQPEQTFGKVVAFLGLERSSQQVGKVIGNTSFEQLARQEETSGFQERSYKQEKFFRRGRSGSWRSMLSPEQAVRLAADHGAVMQRFGYLDNEAP